MNKSIVEASPSYYNATTTDNTKTTEILSNKISSQKLDNTFVGKQSKQTVVAKGNFSETDLIFPHEDIICRGLKIIAENPSIGKIAQDIRKPNIEDPECYIIKTFKHSLPIFQPASQTMATIAGYYNNKYNIKIYIITQNIVSLICDLAKQLNNGEQLGIIATFDPFRNHVTPIILSKNNEEIYIIGCDSINDLVINCYLEDVYLTLIREQGNNSYHLLRTDTKRQQDSYSCVNDAFITLKDALRRPNVITDFFNISKAKYTHNLILNNIKPPCPIGIVEYPKFLYKLVQNKQLLDELTAEDIQTNLKQSTDTEAGMVKKTLQQHFDKHNRIITVRKKTVVYRCFFNTKIINKKWEVNTYLQTKGYRMLVKSFALIDNGKGEIDNNKARLLVQRYINPEYLITR